MKNPFNFPQDDVTRLSTQHEVKEGRLWIFRYKTTIASNSSHSVIFRTKNVSVAVRKFSALLTTDNQSVNSRISFFDEPVFSGGVAETMFPLNQNIQFPDFAERMEVINGIIPSINGSKVFPSIEQEITKNTSGSVGLAQFFLLKNNTDYHGMIENLSNAAQDYNISGVLAYVDI